MLRTLKYLNLNFSIVNRHSCFLTFLKKDHYYVTRSKATLINGKKIASLIHEELKEDVNKFHKQNVPVPHLCLVRIGTDPASASYIKNKNIAAQKIGIKSTLYHLPETTKQSEILQLIQELNNDPSVHGILVQLPLPDHLKEKEICHAVSPEKDVDGFHVINIGRFCLDMNCIGPCTPLGVVELIRRYGIETFGKNAVVCGRSKNVGMPIAMLLHGDGVREDAVVGGFDATTTVCHRYTPPDQLKMFLKNADIIVAAAGIPQFIHGDMIKPGSAVIDVGINRIVDSESGKSRIVGDCHFESCSEVANYISPVPGGVGPMTVAMLMKNTVMAAKKLFKIDRKN